MVLTKAQAEIASNRNRYRVLVCGRKFGKTTLASEEIKGYAIKKSRLRIIYLAPTLGEARRLMWERLKQSLGKAVLAENDTRMELYVRTLDGGKSVIFLGSWELIENYRGDEFDFVALDEVQEYRNFWTGWQEALRPTLTPRIGAALFMGTPKGFTHLYDLFNLEAHEKEFKSFKFTSYENPHLSKDEIETAQRQMTPDRFAQEYLADFRKSEGLVYKEFSREKHLYQDMKFGNEFEYIAGIDFGYQNPAAVLHIYYGKESFWVDDEWYKTSRTDRQVAEYVKGCKFLAVYPDPESPGAIEELVETRVNVREVAKGKNSVVEGIQKVRELLLNEKIKVNRKCLNLIHEFESYSHKDKDYEKNQDENPVKMNDHALDALRYVVMMKKQEVKVYYKQPEYTSMTKYGV